MIEKNPIRLHILAGPLFCESKAQFFFGRILLTSSMFQIKFFIEAFFWGDRMMSEVQTLNDSFLDGNFPFFREQFFC